MSERPRTNFFFSPAKPQASGQMVCGLRRFRHCGQSLPTGRPFSSPWHLSPLRLAENLQLIGFWKPPLLRRRSAKQSLTSGSFSSPGPTPALPTSAVAACDRPTPLTGNVAKLSISPPTNAAGRESGRFFKSAGFQHRPNPAESDRQVTLRRRLRDFRPITSRDADCSRGLITPGQASSFWQTNYLIPVPTPTLGTDTTFSGTRRCAPRSGDCRSTSRPKQIGGSIVLDGLPGHPFCQRT